MQFQSGQNYSLIFAIVNITNLTNLVKNIIPLFFFVICINFSNTLSRETNA
jgi:hypothetical protein